MRRLWTYAGALIAANLVLALIGLRYHVAAVATAEAPASPSQPAVPVARIGLVFDVGGLGDKSFNDSANRGLERAARELGVHTEYREPANGADRDEYLERFADQGVDLVIGVGFIFTDDITKLARERPNVHFACVDYAFKTGPDGKPLAADGKPFPPNLVALTFREEEGSFLVGALAALTAKSHVVGFVGGMKIPLIEKFEAGYTAGAKHVCPDCRVLAAYAGLEPKAFADPTMGRELAMSQIGEGAEVIFHASGKTGQGVFRAVTEAGKLAIGVDSDQAYEAPGHVLTSMVKNVDNAVFKAIQDVRDHRFAGGVQELGLREGGVSYVYDDGNRELVSAAVRAQVEALRQDVIAGRIVVPSRPEAP
jgi:basic membrane protein A